MVGVAAMVLAAVGGAVAFVAGAPPAVRGAASTPDVTPSIATPAATKTTPVTSGAAPSASATSPSASTPQTTRSSPVTARSAKKGVSTWDFSGVSTALRDVGAAWYYNWSAGPTAGAGTSAEFVPMIWGAGSVTAANLDRAKKSGTVLLGFNEPDFADQSNLSVEQALDLWPQLQATGLRLGSPAPAVGAATAGGWLDRFLTGAAQRGLRVDFITVHWYGSDFSAAAVDHLRGYLQAIYDRYHKPIWLTEFALIKFTGSGSVYPSDSQQVAFIRGATAMLEKLTFVQRYAWFALPTPDGRDGIGLYRHGSAVTATPAGTAYRTAG